MAAAPSLDWTDRPRPTALSPEKLAGLIDRTLDRVDGALFTATPRAELDDIGRWQQLKDQAFAGLLRSIIASYNRTPEAQREFVADEIGLALGTTPTTGAYLLGFALSVAELPGLLEAVEEGMLTERHLRAVVQTLTEVPDLSLEARQAIVLLMLAKYHRHTPAELRQLLKRLILTVDRAAAQARKDTADQRRRVQFYGQSDGQGDGQGSIWAGGPAEQIAAIKARLAAELDAQTLHPDDQRGRAAREFDLLVALLTQATLHDQPLPTFAVELLVPFHTALGGDLELAELPGFGPVLPATARDLLNQASTLSRTSIDQDGTILAADDPIPGPAHPARHPGKPQPAEPTAAEPAEDFLRAALRTMTSPPVLRPLASAGYRPGRRLTRFVTTRDRTCVFPGCHRRITDLDHRIPWPLGPTHPDNLQKLCRHHHRAKQAAFTVELMPDGNLRWTTRAGWRFTRQRQGY